MAEADIKLLIGVARGGVDGDSEALIREELNSIMSNIKLKAQIDQKSLKSQVADVLSKTEFAVNIAKVNINDSVFTDLKAKIDAIQSSANGIKTDDLLPKDSAFGNLKTLLSGIDTSAKDSAKSLAEVSKSIAGFADSEGSFAKISEAVQKLQEQFSQLRQSMDGFSGLNINLGLGNSNDPIARNRAYGNAARSGISEMRSQTAALEEYLEKYYGIADKYKAVFKTIQGTSALNGKDIVSVLNNINNPKLSLSGQMDALKEYLAIIQDAASQKGIDLSSVTSGFKKSADEIISDTNKIQSGTDNLDASFEKLKGIFGTSVDTTQLASKIDEIKLSIDGISTALKDVSLSDERFEKLTLTITSVTDAVNKLGTAIKNLSEISTSAAKTVTKTSKAASKAGKTVSEASEAASETASKVSKSANKTSKTSNAVMAVVAGGISTKGASTESAGESHDEYDKDWDRSWRSYGSSSGGSKRVERIERYAQLEPLFKQESIIGSKLSNLYLSDLTEKEVQYLQIIIDYYAEWKQGISEFSSTKDIDLETIKLLCKEYAIVGSKIEGLIADFRNVTEATEKADKDSKAAAENKNRLIGLNKQVSSAGTAVSNLSKLDLNEDEALQADELVDRQAELKRKTDELNKSKETDIEKTKKQRDALLEEANSIEKDALALKELKAARDAANNSDTAARDALEAEYRARSESVPAAIEDARSRINSNLPEMSKEEDKTQANKDLQSLDEYLLKFNDLQDEYESFSRMTTESSATRRENWQKENKELDENIEKLRKRYLVGEEKTNAHQAAEAQTGQIDKVLMNANKYLGWTSARYGKSSDSYAKIETVKRALEDLRKEIGNGDKPVENFKERFESLKNTVNTSGAAIKAAGENTTTLGGRISAIASKFTSWLSVSQVVMQLYNGLRQMVSVVVEVDSAMTELKKVTDETELTYSKFLETASSRAKSLGSTLSDTVTATADFARLGYTLEEASELADASLVYKNVGDGIESISDASESVISTMKAFGVTAEDSMTIVDKFNEVGNNFAISSSGIGEALQRSASALAAGNNTLDESIALVTAANSVVQDPDSVGTSLKTISMYLRAAKTEAEDAGESTDGMATSVSELRKELLRLTGNKVDIMADDSTFKSTYEIVKELAGVWDELSDVSQANILEQIGGKRNSNVVTSLIENFQTAEDVLETTANSAGSALNENAVYLDSISGKISTFKSTFQQLSTNFIDSDLAKFVVELGTGILTILNGVTSLLNKLGGLRSILVVISGIVAAAKIDKILDFLGEKLPNIVMALPNALGKFVDGAAEAADGTSKLAAGFSAMGVSASALQVTIFALSAAIAAAIAIYRNYKQSQQEAWDRATDAADTAEQLSDDITDLTNQYLSLSESVKTNDSVKEELLSTQDELLEKLGMEKGELTGLTAEYGSLTEAIKAASVEKLRNAQIDIVAGVNAREEEVVSTEKSGLAKLGYETGFWSAGQDEVNLAAVQAVKNLGYNIREDESARKFTLSLPTTGEYDTSTVDGVIKSYERLETILKAIQNAGASDSVVYDEIYANYSRLSDVIDEYQDSVGELNNNLAQQYILEGLMGKDLPTTKDEFEEYRQSVLEAANASGKFVGGAEEIEDAIDDILSAETNFADFYVDDSAVKNRNARLGEFGEKLTGAKANNTYVNQLSDLISGSKELDAVFGNSSIPTFLKDLESTAAGSSKSIKTYLDNIEKVEDLQDQLKDSKSEILEDGGLTTETAKDIYNSLVTAGEDYTDYLAVEGDQIQLNTDAYDKFIQKQTLEKSGVQELTRAITDQLALQDEIESLYASLGESGIKTTTLSNPNAEPYSEQSVRNDKVQETLDKITALKTELKELEDTNGDIPALQNAINLLEKLFSDTNEETGMRGVSAALDETKENVDLLTRALAALEEDNGLEDLTKTDFSDLISAFPKLKRVLEEYQDGVISAAQATESLQDALDSIDTDTLFDRLGDAKDGISALADVVNDLRDDKSVSFSTLSDIQNAFAGTDGLDSYIQTLATAKSATTEVADVIGTLLYEGLKDSLGSTEALAEADEALVASMLKEAGIANNTAVAHEAVEQAKLENSVATKAAAASSISDIVALSKEAEAAGSTKQAIYNLIEQQLIFNNTNLTVEEKIRALRELQSAADSAASAVGGVSGYSASAISSKYINQTVTELLQSGKAANKAEAVSQILNNYAESKAGSDALKVGNIFDTVTVTPSTSGSSSSKTEAETIKDTYDELSTALEHAIYVQQEYYNLADNKNNYDEMKTRLQAQVEYYRQIQTAAHEAAEKIRAYYKSQGLSASSIEQQSEIIELQKAWWEAADSIEDCLDQIATAVRDKLSEQLNDIQSVYDTLHNAADEYAASGFISVDTLQTICTELGPKYLSYLRDENGQLVINEENIRSVIAARTEQLAVETALSYVEQIKSAQESGDTATLNNLLYATESATNATWGLVYANLGLLNLDGDQYQAALNNINALRALAESAISGIGQTTEAVSEHLQEMKDGLDDILQYVMDMLEQRIQDEIDALGDMKDAYADIIDLRKEALEAAEEEADYQDEIAEKVKELAKLQERINALSLDDSRDAQSQKAQLEEEMAELQKELAKTQSEYAVNAQEEALDKMQEAYEEEKDQEIEVLEESISSYQKKYDMAISYISSNWDTLYSELLNWNYSYGDELNSTITTAWENALAAAQQYGSYVSALNSIDADIDAASSSGTNTVVGTSYSGATDEEMIHAIIKEMYANSQAWQGSSTENREKLDKRNLTLGAMLAQYGINAYRKNGAWYVDGGELLYEKYKQYTYHTGGIAGNDPSLEQNEVLAVLEKGEAVLDEKRQKGLYTLIDFNTTLSEKLGKLLNSSGLSKVFNSMQNGFDTNQAIPVTAGAQIETIHFGDVYIYGANDETVAKHREINRQFTNEILKQLNLKR